MASAPDKSPMSSDARTEDVAYVAPIARPHLGPFSAGLLLLASGELIGNLGDA
jgi:hypothetical protein